MLTEFEEVAIWASVLCTVAAMIEALNHGDVIVGLKINEEWAEP